MSGTLAIFRLPLEPTPQTFLIVLSGVTYAVTLTYRDIAEPGSPDFILRTESPAAPLPTQGDENLLTGYDMAPPVQAGGWIMDLCLNDGTPLLLGLALVTGLDLLAPYPHLGLPGKLLVVGTADPDLPPTFDNLGSECNVYYALLA